MRTFKTPENIRIAARERARLKRRMAGVPVAVKRTPIERFMSFVQKDDTTRCWIWSGFKGERGYGEFGDGSKVVRAHRWSFEYHVRKLAHGEVVCHRCDTPACVNPEHLFAGDQSVNLNDAIAKGRKKIREQSSAYKGAVTREIVADIRKRRASGESNTAIAEHFGISQAYCSTIARGIHWPEVGAV